MFFKEKTIYRTTSFVWLILLILLSLFWWILCIAESIINIFSKNGRENFFVMLFKTYRSICSEFNHTLISIKTGEKIWR